MTTSKSSEPLANLLPSSLKFNALTQPYNTIKLIIEIITKKKIKFISFYIPRAHLTCALFQVAVQYVKNHKIYD